MPDRRFPPPWTVEDIGGSFVVKGIAANIAKLPEPLERRQLV